MATANEYHKKYCERMIEKYSSKIDSKYCTGLPIEIKDPDEISATELNIWADYKRDSYPANLLEKIDYHLVCVMIGAKPVALLDVDAYPSDEKQHDSFMRFVSYKCDVRSLISDRYGQQSTIYYHKDHWTNAMILFLFHEQLLDSSIRNQITKTQGGFDAFQGILLGYNKDSFIDYSFIHYSIGDVFKVPTVQATEEEIKDSYQQYYKIFSKLKRKLSSSYEEMQKLIETLKSKVENEPCYRACALQDVPVLK